MNVRRHRTGAARGGGEMPATTTTNVAGKRRTLPNNDEHESEADVDDNDNTMFLLTVTDHTVP